MTNNHNHSVFDVVDAEYHRLIQNGFQIDCRRIDQSLPQHKMSPPALKAVMMSSDCLYVTRDAVWRYLIDQSRRDSRYSVITLGLLQPGMRRAAGRMVRVFGADPEEVDDELLTGVIEAIANINLASSKLASRLLTSGIDRARRHAITSPSLGHVDHRVTDVMPIPHPEVRLWRAVDEGILSAQEAELIAATRLDGDTVADIAGRFGMKPNSLFRQRRRAEERLASWIRRNL